MSFEALLLHTAEVYRRPVDDTGDPQLDRFGQAKGTNPSTLTGALDTSFPCRASSKKGSFVMQERAIDIFQNRYVVFTMPGATIFEDDAVRVVAADGNEIFPKAKVKVRKEIYDSVGLHHLEFECWVQEGPSS